jgi:hypothetical protein
LPNARVKDSENYDDSINKTSFDIGNLTCECNYSNFKIVTNNSFLFRNWMNKDFVKTRATSAVIHDFPAMRRMNANA